MPFDLYVGPRRKRRWPGLPLVFLALLLLVGLNAWRHGWRPSQALQAWSSELPAPVALPLGALPLPQLESASPDPAEPVVRLTSAVVESPQSPAYTAALYQAAGSDNPVPWPNVGGRTNILTYTVQEGDTLWSIAAAYELDLDTLRWSNPVLEANPDILAVGTELIILPVDGVYHMVSPGDTLESIAALYGVAPVDIAHYPPNDLYPPYNLEIGRGLIVPLGRKDGSASPTSAPITALAWPAEGQLTGDFDPDHPALALHVPPGGTTIRAAAAGKITFAGPAQPGPGYTVTVDHGGGLETHYLALTGLFLPAGSYVAAGTALGEIGGSDRAPVSATFRFEVHLNGQPVDPRPYLVSSKP